MNMYFCVSGGKKYKFFGKFCVCTKWMTTCMILFKDYGPEDYEKRKQSRRGVL